MDSEIMKISPKWVPKSMKKRGCVAAAFLERLGPKKGGPPGLTDIHFGSHFRSKIVKKLKKGAKGTPNAAKSQKKTHKTNNAESDTEKESTITIEILRSIRKAFV